MGTGRGERYGAAAVALHWATAALVVFNLGLGVSMVPLAISPTKLQWYLTHKSIGITVFVLTAARLLARLVAGVPAPVAMPDWQRRAAAAVHALLYALLIVVPVSGWLYSSSTGVQVVYLGTVALPDLVPKDRSLAAALKAVHVSLNLVLVTLVAVHAAAALRHHFVDRDAVLSRMLPLVKPRSAAKAVGGIASMVLLGLALALAGAADAQGVVVEKSEIRFVSKQLGVNFEGRFRKWRANVVFRPADLAKSKAELDIDLASIDLASDDSENEVKGPLWFDMAKFPTARFVSTAIRSTGTDRYEVAGRLSLKGTTKDVVVPIALRKDAGGNTVAEGSFTVNRMEFRIGEGLWADPATVANEVAVRVRMVLAPA